MKVKNVIKSIEALPMTVVSHIPGIRRYAFHFLIQQAREYGDRSDHFCALLRRPKYASQIVSVEKETPIRRKTAIIMQGPLVAKNDLTVETVKIYGKLYPGVTVIVSSWEDEDQQVIGRLRTLSNCEVVLSKKPEYSGVLNLNYQVVSTMAGLRRAKELGMEYAAKTRCDFRFVKYGLIEYLAALCDEFPLDESVGFQQQRIIVMGDYFASVFRAFWVADRFTYGRTEDMLSYWDYELDMCDWAAPVVHKMREEGNKTWLEVTEAGLGAEPRILLNYLKRMGVGQLECTVKNFWDVLKRQFITLSYNELGAYWVKNNHHLDEATTRGDYCGEKDSPEKCFCYNWDFAKWLALYRGSLQYSEEYEQFQLKNVGLN